jgi:hypothetical protein
MAEREQDRDPGQPTQEEARSAADELKARNPTAPPREPGASETPEGRRRLRRAAADAPVADDPAVLKAELDAARKELEELRAKTGRPRTAAAGMDEADLPEWDCRMPNDPTQAKPRRVRAADEANAREEFLRAIGATSTEHPIQVVLVDEEAEAAARAEAEAEEPTPKKAPRKGRGKK